jgi:hypothetical protein
MKTLFLLIPILCFANIEKYIAEKARQLGIPEDVAICVAQTESSLNPSVMGDDNKSIGLFQLQCTTAKDIGKGDIVRYPSHYPCRWLLNYKHNTKFALRYLEHKIDSHGLYYGLGAYNQGHVCVRHGKLCNREYVLKILKCLLERL